MPPAAKIPTFPPAVWNHSSEIVRPATDTSNIVAATSNRENQTPHVQVMI